MTPTRPYPGDDRVWLGLDIGTSAIRVAAHARDGRLVATARVDRPPRSPVPGAMFHDPDDDWWLGTCEALMTLWSGLRPERVAGIGLAALFPAFCLVDIEGQAISEGILFGDSRGQACQERVEELLALTLQGDEVSPRLLWLDASRPGLLGRAAWALGPAGLVCLRLTGARAIDRHSAVRWGGLAPDGGGWDENAARRLGIPRNLLPPIVAPTQVVGAVTDRAAEITGLLSGTPVVMGATDSFCQLLGCGISRPGDALVYYGSTGTLMVPTVDFATAVADPKAFRDGSPYRLAAYLVRCGTFLDLLRRELLGSRAFRELDGLAVDVAAGSDGLLAYPSMVVGATGGPAADGSGALVGLSLGHTAAHVWRAALESFGFVLMEAKDGLSPEPTRVAAAGGGARSEVWRSIVSHQTGWSQGLAPDGGASRGAAFLAALGTGELADVDELRERWLPDQEGTVVVRPDAVVHARYRELLRLWQAGARALSEPG